MPKLGEIKIGPEIGYKSLSKYIYVACIDCGKVRWNQYVKGNAVSLRCCSCERKRRPDYKGGREATNAGYIQVRVYEDDFFYPMTRSHGYVLEHRLVMAKHLSRCLLPWEVVHHKNGVKSDNRLENLELVPEKRWHLVDAATKRYVNRLEKRMATSENRITLLEAENVLLRERLINEKATGGEPVA